MNYSYSRGRASEMLKGLGKNGSVMTLRVPQVDSAKKAQLPVSYERGKSQLRVTLRPISSQTK